MVIRRRSAGSDKSSSPPARPQGEEGRSGAGHQGADPAVGFFGKSKKIIDFQSALFATEITLDRLCMSISHGAASFAMGVSAKSMFLWSNIYKHSKDFEDPNLKIRKF